MKNLGGWEIHDFYCKDTDELLDIMGHILPINDTKEHQLNEACSCKPVHDIDIAPQYWVHNSFDGREKYEQNLRKVN